MRLRSILCAVICCVCLVLFSPSQGLTQEAEMSPTATQYLGTAIAVMQQHSLHKKQIDWEQFRKAAMKEAQGAQTPEQTYGSIRFALGMLGDHHSFLQLSPELQAREAKAPGKKIAQKAAAMKEEGSPSPFTGRRAPAGHLVTHGDRRIALVEVPAFGAGDDGAIHEFAEALQRVVAQLAGAKPVGWIVDLRGNVGGNMWPMLTGLTPLLQGEEPLGFFVDDEQHKEIWTSSAKGAGIHSHDGNKAILCWTPAQLVTFAEPQTVAVLMDRGTASSGEAVAIAFQGRKLSRSFGRHTHGQSTANQMYPLPDGANLVLTTAVDADRTGKVYLDGIQPDVELPEQKKLPESDESDGWVQAASDWIVSQADRR